MFRRTLIKLTVLNTAIFFILLSLLSSTVYFYTKSVFYRSVDQSLQEASNHFGVNGAQIHDPQIGVIIWDSNNKMIAAITHSRDPFGIGDPLLSSEKKLKHIVLNQFQDQKVGSFYFRTLSTKIITNDYGVVTVQFFELINAQKSVLQTLLIIIIVSLVVGILLAAGAGLFLAHRALKPIQKAWDRQQQFVSDASHEIRTPLTIIQSRIEMLLQSPRATIQDKINDISISLQETRRLSKLVSHLLTLARSDANQIEIQEEPILMNDLIRTVVEQFEELASYEDKKLVLNMTHQPVYILGDKQRLHQLLVIFLDNALKFTGENGEIKVLCHQEANTVFLEVKDNGIGIKPEHLGSIFDRFFQADTSRTDREGTGLGLSIAKWIVEKHRGKLTVKSELGKGTHFTMSFPAAKTLTKP